MIRRLVDFALDNRVLILAVAILLLIWGVISFHNLPVEAYPDVANNYVQVITQWPGRAAEEVEQQVTIPIEIVMNGLPHLEHLRSYFAVWALQRDADLRRRIRQRLEPAESAGAAVAVTLPANLQPQIGTDYSPVGQIYWYTLNSTNPHIRFDGVEVAAKTGCWRSNSSPSRTWWMWSASAAPRRSIRCRSIRTSWCPTGSASARSSSSSPITT